MSARWPIVQAAPDFAPMRRVRRVGNLVRTPVLVAAAARAKEKVMRMVRVGCSRNGSRVAATLATLALAGVFLALPPAGDAGTFTVSSLNDDGAGSLRQAILGANAAAGADTITFGSAVSGTITVASTLPAITDAAGLTIRGPGAGVLTISGGHAVRVFDVASGASLSLDGLTVANGGNRDLAAGGGVSNAGTLTVSRSTFSGNAAAGCPSSSFGVYSSGGGAIFSSGTLTVADSVFSGNAAFCGSGIFNSGTATVTDSTLSGNGGATNPDTYYGGGVLNTGTLTITGSTLSENGVWGWGAGIVNSGDLTVGDSTISANRTGVEGGSGILNHSGATLVLTDSTLSGNRSNLQGDGGGIENLGTATVAGSTLSGNGSSGGVGTGGGIYNGGTLTVADSTLSGNLAGLGGGAVCNAGTLTVSFSTISGNEADGFLGGGGIRAGCWPGQPATGPTTLAGTILAGNSDANCSVDALTDGGYDISSDASCAFSGSTSLAGTDPMLGPLGDHGGPTQTMALLAGSPAVNRVPPGVDGCGTTVASDQRGVSRPVGAGCDVGAYEDASPAVQLAYLLAAVAGVGPGSSLADRIKHIRAAVAENGAGAACLRLNAFVAEIRALAGKKLGPAQASLLASEAEGIETLSDC